MAKKNFIVIILIWTVLTIMKCASVHRNNTRRFPDNFMFGAATAAYQVEGAWNVSDKTMSIWDYACHYESGNIANGENGDVACDSYHQYKRDVQMLRELGVDFYRFSVSWPRILPTGFNNYVSKDGILYYNNLINELLKYNIQPVITMYHWDLPQSLQDLGGWTNSLIVNWFEDYAQILFELFGDRVKTWITINEPHSVCHYGHGPSETDIFTAPFLQFSGIADYLCVYNIIKSHAAVYHMYDKMFRSAQKGRVGISVQIVWTKTASETVDDMEAALNFIRCRTNLYLDPIFSTEGGFPSKCIKQIANKSALQGFKRSRLAQFTPEEIASIKGTADFLGINHYTTVLVYRNSSIKEKVPIPSWSDDINAMMTYSTEWPSGTSTWLKVAPWGFRKLLNYYHKKYKNVEIIITENGFSSLSGREDEDRVDYYRQYLNALLDAILLDGVNVSGYTAWSLMDNFEWASGYRIQFGLYEVDFKDPLRKRTAKKSAIVYKEIVKSRIIDYDFRPTTIDILN